jgi:hypothetical protein
MSLLLHPSGTARSRHRALHSSLLHIGRKCPELYTRATWRISFGSWRRKFGAGIPLTRPGEEDWLARPKRGSGGSQPEVRLANSSQSVETKSERERAEDRRACPQ